MTDVSAQAKFQKVLRPQALPGCCALCNRADEPFYIDTGFSIEFLGAVYIGGECLGQMAELAGFATPELRSELERKISNLIGALADSQSKMEGMEQLISGYQHLNPTFTRNFDGTYGSGDDDSVSSESNATDEKGTQRGTVDVGAGEGETPRQSDDEGMGELRQSPSSTGKFKFEI